MGGEQYEYKEEQTLLISEWENKNLTVYYLSENAPETEGNFWHYVDGVPTVW